jgi:small subunit ribosomal protein S17
MIEKKKTLVGTVIGKLGQKTVKVLVETSSFYQKYGKIFTRRKKYLVHSEENIKMGSRVIIAPDRPFSKRKSFKVLKVLK